MFSENSCFFFTNLLTIRANRSIRKNRRGNEREIFSRKAIIHRRLRMGLRHWGMLRSISASDRKENSQRTGKIKEENHGRMKIEKQETRVCEILGNFDGPGWQLILRKLFSVSDTLFCYSVENKMATEHWFVTSRYAVCGAPTIFLQTNPWSRLNHETRENTQRWRHSFGVGTIFEFAFHRRRYFIKLDAESRGSASDFPKSEGHFQILL